MAELVAAKERYAVLRTAIDKMKGQFKLTLPRHITADRFARIIFTQIQTNPLLLNCTQESVLAAVMRSAERGLLPDGRLGALVPFRNKKKGGVYEAQFMPMYQGLIDLMRRSGEIVDVFAATVYDNDTWSYQLGLHKDLVHQPCLRGDRGPPVAYYAVAEYRTGQKAFLVMRPEEIEAVRRTSRAGDEGPWVQWPEQMSHKTVLKRLAKILPQTEELSQALEEDAAVEVGDFIEAEAEPAPGNGPSESRLDTLVQQERATKSKKPKPPAEAAPREPVHTLPELLASVERARTPDDCDAVEDLLNGQPQEVRETVSAALQARRQALGQAEGQASTSPP